MINEKRLETPLKKIFEGKYIIPFYQRAFAWKENEITSLLQDVYESFSKDPKGRYFIGSLIVCKRQLDGLENYYEVIDGQQRLTALNLILKILNVNNSPNLLYDARPEVQNFLKLFYDGKEINQENEMFGSNMHLAVGYIKDAVLSKDNPNLKIKNLETKKQKAFADYFINNVILVRVELPLDTDVAAYFEIMNNRGVQLQMFEVIKARLMEKIDKPKERDLFTRVWNACSQIDEPVQKFFSAEERKNFFGNYFNQFYIENVSADKYGNSYQRKEFNIDEIIDEKKKSRTKDVHDSEEKDGGEEIFSSIIDFPNFLMHVFKLYYNETYSKIKKEDIPLNEKYMEEVYSILAKHIDSMEFLQRLLKCKTYFDRFIIKVIKDGNDDDCETWSLRQPVKYGKSLRFTKNTFDDQKMQDRIIKALSMLHVTFRTKIYKNWLQDILCWLVRYDNVCKINGKDYVKKLDEIILSYYNNSSDYRAITVDKMYSKGTSTPHFLFNFIDYLYWVEWKNKNKHEISELKLKESFDFEFKNWNSVEHHLAQNLAKEYKCSDIVDCLGNLCLISKESNSRLSDRDVKDKVKFYKEKNLGPNRKIIYKMTEDNNYSWEKKNIEEHYAELVKLLQKRTDILNDVEY